MNQPNGRYGWLLFDADGTLFDYDRAEGEALAAAFQAAGLPLEEQYLSAYRRINGELWQAFEQGAIAQEQLKVERFARLAAEAGLVVDPAWWSQTYLEELGKGAYLIPGVESVLAALHGRYRMAIITNGLQAVQRARFGRSPIQAYFEGLVISEEVGSAKPDPAIFDAAFDLMGSPAREQVLIIGDSLTSDIAGGLNYGIDTCWVNPEKRPRPDGWAITYEIATLAELPGVLGLP